MNVVMMIIRPDHRVACGGCKKTSNVKQLMIERNNMLYEEITWWHFDCALMNDIVIEDTIVRMARQFRGKTR